MAITPPPEIYCNVLLVCSFENESQRPSQVQLCPDNYKALLRLGPLPEPVQHQLTAMLALAEL